MSDEESFVILGTSPTASMETVDSLPATESLNSNNLNDELQEKRSTNNDLECQLTNSAASSNTSQYTVVNKLTEDQPKSITEGNGAPISTQDKPDAKTIENPKVNSMQNSGSSNSSVGENLAASFILGEVDSTVLKSSLQSQFPSVLASTPPLSEIDIHKDVIDIEQYEQLRLAVVKNNQTLKFICEQSTKWKKEARETEEKRKIEIAKLRNENLQLRKDLEIKIEQLQINENLRAVEQKELIRSISEKQSQIKNMSVMIERLEQHQLKSYEYIPKNDQEEAAYQGEDSSEYVSRAEHERVIKDLERRLSELVAEILDLKDIQKQYIDELNCLKVNLTAAEELQKAGSSRCQTDNQNLRAEIDILRQQLDLYCRDFKIEHEARENLANEKDQLISDLRELQKRNQELIKEAQRNYEEHAKQTMAPTGAFPKRRTLPDPSKLPQSSSALCAPTTTYACPLCGQVFKTLSVLQEHVNQCLDGN